MKLLFTSPEDAFDVRTWSGINVHMREALERAGADVITLSPLRSRAELPVTVLSKAATVVSRRRFLAEREPLVLRNWSRRIEVAVARAGGVDVVFSSSSLPISLLGSAQAAAFWTDATFGSLVGYYPEFQGLSRRTTRLGNRMEAAALDRCLLAFYSSEWAAESAVQDYGAASSKVAVVPFGANVADPGPVHRTPAGEARCALLIVGKDWYRKGVDQAVLTVDRLRQSGVPATLDVVGASPPDTRTLPSWVTLHGSLDKSSAVDSAALAELYRRASFFILPSVADCTPVVLAEAQAYSLPVVASATGGMATVVAPGAGTTLGLDGFADAAAAYIAAAWREPAAYARLSRAARAAFETRLNWDAGARSVLAALDAALRSGRP